MPDDGARKRLGNAAERFAAGWLEARGYVVVARNWRCPYGELDLVAERDGELIFVEVKTRRGEALGAPEEAVTPAKRRRLILAAQSYLAEYGAEQWPWRIDVVAVSLAPSGKLLGVHHYLASISEEG